MRPITGAELTLDDGSHLTLLCESREGYTNLCRLITARALAHPPLGARGLDRAGRPRSARSGGRARTRSTSSPRSRSTSSSSNAAGLVCLSGCARDGAVARRIEAGDHPGAAAVARRLLGAFGPDRFRIELQRPWWQGDRRRNRLLAELARAARACPASPPATCTPTSARGWRCRTRMVAVRLGATLDETEPRRRGNSSHVLAPPERMAERFADHPEAVHESGRLAERLRFDLTEDLGYRYPGAEDADSRRRRWRAICRDAHRASATPAGRRWTRRGRAWRRS